MKFSKRTKVSTFAKYLFSYIAIFTVLIGGFFLILRSQLEKTYHVQRTEQIHAQLRSLGDHLNSEVAFLSQIDRLVTGNDDIILANYRSESKYHGATYAELEQYADSSSLIDTIVYYSRFSGHVFSSGQYCTIRDGAFILMDGEYPTLEFDPEPWLDCNNGQLIWLSGKKTGYLIYFPPNNSSARYLYFYILDVGMLQSQLKTLQSEELPAVALVDGEGRCVTGINFGSTPVPTEDGIYPLEGSRSLCVCSGLRGGFSIAAVISEEFLSRQVNETFLSAWLSLLGLSVLGIVLVWLAMSMTYKPLNSFIRSIAPSSHRGQNYFELLSENFSDLRLQKQQLQKNLDNYRTFVQKDLMGSVLTQQFAVSPAVLDRIFEAVSPSGLVLVVKVSGKAQLLEPLSGALRPQGSCFCLSKTENGALYLAVLSGEGDIPMLKAACAQLHGETGCLFALSDPSGSILDLPMLCENAAAACGAWPQTAVAEYRLPDSGPNPFAYPHEALNQLSALLRSCQFSQARETIQSIFAKLEQHNVQSALPAYFSNCIVLDLLTILSNSMSLDRIDFNAYSDIFYEAIRLCRDFQPEENTQELQLVISELLFFYEKEASNRLSHVAPLQQLMERNFCQPEFSISVIADTYHVSISRMSVLFKKEMGLGFTDCLWQMRLKKAQELLSATDLSIDEISVTVGYLNPNSFRRKFKQETGLSPSQYRDSLK